MIVPHDLASKVVMPAIRCKMAEIMINKFGLSQSQAADSLGVTQASISNYVRGVRIPSITLSSDLEEELEFLVRDLINNSGKKQEVMIRISELCNSILTSRLACDIHAKMDNDLDIDTCNACSDLLSIRSP